MVSTSIACIIGCGAEVSLSDKMAAALAAEPSLKDHLMLICDKCVKSGKKDALMSSVAEINDHEAPEASKEASAFYREYEYLWTIEQFSNIRHLPKGLGFLAPFFRTMSGVEGAPDAEWSWGVLPCNINVSASDKHLALFIRLRNFDQFRSNGLKIVANVEFKVYDREMNVLKVHRKHADKDISDWVTRDGVNAYSFLPHELLDETLAKESSQDIVVFGAKLRVRIDHEVSELQRDKKLIEYSTHASVDKFCFQYRIENYLEHPQSSKYEVAAQFPQQLPSGKVALWEATYRRSPAGDLGAKLKLVNGDQFGNCELVTGTHFMVLSCGGGAEGGEGGTIGVASQQGQRMRDDWNLSTVEDGWGRSKLMSDEQIIKNKNEVLDSTGALVLNFTIFLSTSTHDRKEGSKELGKASLDGGKSVGAEGNGGAKQIMLSYNWGTKQTVHKIKDRLESWGYKTWIDDNQMGDNVMLSMAEGVFNSDAVLICLTDNYQNSFNCQREASMTFDERKPMIPLKLEGDVEWKPWVKLLISGKRYIEMERSPSFDDFMQELKTYLERMEELKK